MKLKLIIGIVGILSACGFTNAPSLDTNQEKQDNNWVIGPFLRPEGVNPVISPQPTEFYCPMRKQQVKWEESDTFNPAATVKDGKIAYSREGPICRPIQISFPLISGVLLSSEHDENNIIQIRAINKLCVSAIFIHFK